MANKAANLAALGRLAEALQLREETLVLRRAKLGPDHPDTILTMGSLGGNYALLGRHAEVLKIRQETLALLRARSGPDHPETLLASCLLAESYLATGGTAERSLLEGVSAADPKETTLSLYVAALQSWFGRDKELADTRRRLLAHAERTGHATAIGHAAQVCSLLPPAGPPELDASIVLARRAVDFREDAELLDVSLMALGMAQYRPGTLRTPRPPSPRRRSVPRAIPMPTAS